jgi:diadenosine tetraphosphate (Ap4A) HIT family hydrolase
VKRVRRIEKAEALQLLEAYKQSLPAFDCLPCALSRDAACATRTIASDDHGVVLLNRFAQRHGHLMVVPRRHVEHVHELPWPAYAALQKLAYDASSALMRVLQPLRIFHAVLGSAAPVAQSYAHLHIHVLPIYEADDRARPARAFSWSEGIVVYEDAEALKLTRQLAAAWLPEAQR